MLLETSVPSSEWSRALLAGAPALYLDFSSGAPSDLTTSESSTREHASFPERQASDEATFGHH
eukprot:5800009-Pyramimonas_sp.AAC.1